MYHTLSYGSKVSRSAARFLNYRCPSPVKFILNYVPRLIMGNTRKLIKWGSSNTLIISLPRKWIKANGLKPNQSVKLQENPDGTITVVPQEISTESFNLETAVKIKDPTDLENIRLRILTKYLDGWDVIRIESKEDFPPTIRIKIEEMIDPLMGLEIMGVSTGTIIIKNVMAVDSSNVYNLVKMISDLSIELSKMIYNQLSSSQKPNEKIGQIEWENIHKYHYRITREHRRALLHPIVLTKMELTLQDIMDFSFYVNAVYKIGEALKYILDTMNKHDLPPDKFGIIRFYEKVQNIFRDSVDSFLFTETSKAIQVIKRIKKERPNKREIENDVDIEEGSCVDSHPKLLSFQIILDHCEKIMDYCENVCLAALRRAI